MIWAMLGLMAGFMLVLVILGFLLIKTELALWLKILAVLVVSLFYWVEFVSLQQYTGWPTTDGLPPEFVLIATDVHEPDKKKGTEGVMYWWLRDSSNLDQPPRVYQLPYEPETHKQSQQVIEEQKKGNLYVGRKNEQAGATGGLGVSFEKISKASRLKKQ